MKRDTVNDFMADIDFEGQWLKWVKLIDTYDNGYFTSPNRCLFTKKYW